MSLSVLHILNKILALEFSNNAQLLYINRQNETLYEVRKLEKFDQGESSGREVNIDRASRKPQDDRANNEKPWLMRERIHGGKYLEAKIYLKHGLLNDGELGLLRFTMLLTRTAENIPSATKVKAKKGYKITTPMIT